MTSRIGRGDKKALLGTGMKSLSLGKPLRLGHVVCGLESGNPVKPPEGLNAAQAAILPASDHPASYSRDIEESGAFDNPVTARPGHRVTLLSPKEAEKQGHEMSELTHDPVSGSPKTPVIVEPCHAKTELSGDQVSTKPGQAMTPSVQSGISEGESGSDKRRLRVILRAGVLKPKEHFCAIPTVLLSQAGIFENTFDFTVYLYFFSKSYGYGRNTCDMGIAELMRFTGLAKNSVRKCLERLTAQKWIRMIQNFEAGHVTRKWRVYSPYENGRTDHPTHVESGPGCDLASGGRQPGQPPSTGAGGDPVTSRPDQAATPTGSPDDPVTGSPRDPYKNRDKNNFKKISLSACAEPIRSYFSEPMPLRKRESEWQAYRELQESFSDTDIADCLIAVQSMSLTGGESCHSPMAYLAVAMSDVLAKVNERRAAEARRLELASQQERLARRQAEEEERSRRELELREQAFVKFLEGRNESEVVAEICRRHGFPLNTGQVGRMFAVTQWWQDFQASGE